MTSAFMKTIIVSASVLALAPARAQSARQQGGVAEGRLNPTTTSAARAEFWAGVDDWQSFSFASAIKHFRKAVAIDPSFGLARAMAVGVPPRTLAEYKSGEMDRGVGDAARASTAEGLYALAWREKAADHFERAAQLFHATMELLPNDAHVANEYVWELSFYAPKPALDSAKAIRARFPAYAPLEAAVAVFLINSGDSTAALAAAQDYLQHAPGRPAAPNLYGSILQLVGRFDEAEVQYKRQLAMEPVRADFGSDAASSLVQLYLLTNRADDARALALQELPRLGDARDSANYLAAAASAALFAGDSTGGIRLLEAARRKAEYVGDASSPYPVDVLLANAHALSGDRRAVPTYLARIQPIRPSDSAQATAWRATAYARAGALDSTLKYIDRFVATSGFPASVTTPWAHMTRGVAYEHTKQCARALDELRQADTTSMDVQGALAECSLQQGDREAALRWRDRVLAQRMLNLFFLSDVDARRRMAALK
jgi:tetratricopeptide (TPR) repeat protein